MGAALSLTDNRLAGLHSMHDEIRETTTCSLEILVNNIGTHSKCVYFDYWCFLLCDTFYFMVFLSHDKMSSWFLITLQWFWLGKQKILKTSIIYIQKLKTCSALNWCILTLKWILTHKWLSHCQTFIFYVIHQNKIWTFYPFSFSASVSRSACGSLWKYKQRKNKEKMSQDKNNLMVNFAFYMYTYTLYSIYTYIQN